ncbi:MAG: leucine--tRNA ligase [Anaerolineaceae bacterium]
MADRYEPHVIEPKWQQRWETDQLYYASDEDARTKWYELAMFPYPSGDLHTGHWYHYAGADTHARYMRMLGYNVLFPMGFDAFGLPAENAAIKRGVDPADWTRTNIVNFRRQFKMMGASFDWSREVVTSEPDYYKWSQWWFLQMYNRGLAYRAAAAANWCPGCQTVLANEQVVGGRCERSDDVVERRFLTQWFFKITEYAEELLRFDGIEWPERIMAMQSNWIGRSEGAVLEFEARTGGAAESLGVFTTRPDTAWGATFLVLAPEHALVNLVTTAMQRKAVTEYVQATARASEIERLSTDREKSGVFTGGYALNPFSGVEVPIWIADYVLVTYGTGAIMAVPAHDQRDFEFATKFGLPIVPVYDHPEIDVTAPLKQAIAHGGRMINSGPFDGTPGNEAVQRVIAHAVEKGFGKATITYRLRDWLISRQRYWGAPIPIIHCEQHGILAVPEADLPVELPDHPHFEATGQSPLKQIESWVNAPCPIDGAPARRETDTLDTFMCSSWYQMRYADPRNTERPFSSELGRKWLPVDQYTGGADHAVMHLLYTRFFWKAARDMGIVEGDEPMLRLFNQGTLLGPDGQKMSKSRGNVVAPDDQVAQWGADAFRCQLMFVGPWDQGGPYNPSGMSGIVKWLHRLWGLATEEAVLTSDPKSEATRSLRRATHKAIRAATDEMAGFRFNTLISRLMEHSTAMHKARAAGRVDREAWEEAVSVAVLLTAPMAPHLAEELWARMGKPYSVHQQAWPVCDAGLATDDEIELVVQVNGKVRDRITLPMGASEADARAAVFASETVQQWLKGAEPRRVIYVPGRLFNIVL